MEIETMVSKKFVGGWWMWIVFLLIITVLIFTVLNYAGTFGKTVVERKIFENSYQKQEADKEAISAYESELRILRARLSNPNIDVGTRAEIKAQIDSIAILKSTKVN